MDARMCRRPPWSITTNTLPFSAHGSKPAKWLRPTWIVVSPSGNPSVPPVGPGADGPLCVVYEEVSEGLDGMEWSRYWMLSNHWHMGHAPCVENLAALVHVAQHAGCW